MTDRINPRQLNAEFAQIHMWILVRPEILPMAKLVYALLCKYAGINGFCCVRRSKIAKDLGGVHINTVQNSISQLEDFGLIEVEKEQGKTNKYFFKNHPWMCQSYPQTHTLQCAGNPHTPLCGTHTLQCATPTHSSVPHTIKRDFKRNRKKVYAKSDKKPVDNFSKKTSSFFEKQNKKNTKLFPSFELAFLHIQEFLSDKTKKLSAFEKKLYNASKDYDNSSRGYKIHHGKCKTIYFGLVEALKNEI